MKVTVGIKALNEERHIDAAVRSALAACRPLGGEVILADSGSADRTIAIASRHPIRIVQLADPAERCCGAGAQLAFQHAAGEFFYLLDGDMRLDPGFLGEGIAFLEAHPDVAGVGGRVREVNTANAEFEIRARAVRDDSGWHAGFVDRLDCGGLYRTEAIRAVGYFADRNLHAFEEFELGARLAAAGWRLARIDRPAVDHHGHVEGGYRLMWRRIRSGYAGATGEVLRAAFAGPHWRVVLRRMSHIRFGAIVILWWLAAALAIAAGRPLLLAALLIAPVLLLSIRRRSLALGLYSFASWNVLAWGLISGALRGRTPPDTPLAARQMHDGQPADSAAAVRTGPGTATPP